MDFWRAYRVLAARKWLITAVVILTTAVVGIGLLFFGRKYDAQTGFGPTPEAVRAAVTAGNDEKNMPMLTEDSRMDEAKRIYEEVRAPDNVRNAVYYLANAPLVRAALQNALGSTPLVDGKPAYAAIASNVSTAKARMSSDDIAAARRAIPTELWADFIYLDATLDSQNVSKESFKQANIDHTVNDLLNNIEVTPLNSRDITLSVRDRDTRLAEVLASAITAAYKSDYDNRNHKAADDTQKFLAVEARRATRRFAVAQSSLSDFRRTHKDIFLPDQVSQAIRAAELARTQVDSVQASLKDLDAQIAAKSARLVSLPRMLKHPVQADNAEIASLRAKIADLNADIASKSAVWTDKNPEMVRLRAQVKSLQARLSKVQGSMVTTTNVTENDEFLTLEREIAGLSQSRKGLAARLGTLNAVLAKQTGLVASLPESSTLAQMLQGEYAAAGEALQTASKKLAAANEELAVANAKGALQVRYWAGVNGTTDHPETPAREGAAKRNWAIFIAAILLSLVGSAGIVLGLDYLDTSVKSSMDVERMLDVPVNGIVPRLDGPNHTMLAQVTHKLPASPQAESYRFLGADILLSASGDQPFKTIMVATAKPGQGGTSTICNLAITLAQAGQTVVLVDADLRRPSLHQIFNVSNEQGLTTVLSNGKLPSDVLQRTEIENLFVMPGGPHTDNAWKLLRSAKMKDVIADLERDFDFVLFDTPSAVVFADAATIATMVDGVLLVVRAHEAPSGSELQVKNLLNKTKARIVGVVLNDMPLQQVDSARYFSHYYGDTGKAGIAAGAAAGAPKPALPRRGSDEEI